MLILKRTYWYIIVISVIGLLCTVSASFSSEAGMTASQPQLDQPRGGGGPSAPVANRADTTGSNGSDSSAFTKPAGSGEKGKAASPANGPQEVYRPVQSGEGDRK
jgi:hypothetical protein